MIRMELFKIVWQRIDFTQKCISNFRYKGTQLDFQYTVFGEVVEGLNIIDSIANVQVAPGDRPVQDVRMDVKILN